MKVISFLSTVYAAGKQWENKRIIIIKRHLSLVTPSMDSEWGEKQGINEWIKLNYAALLKLSEHLPSVSPSISHSFRCPFCAMRVFRMQLGFFLIPESKLCVFQLLMWISYCISAPRTHFGVCRVRTNTAFLTHHQLSTCEPQLRTPNHS